MRRHLRAGGGKFRRGTLALIVGGIAGAPGDATAVVAAAAEAVHLATLIHDDILDGAARRRARPSLHRVFGTGPALLYGDLLFVRAVAAVHALGNTALTACLLHAVQALCRGEMLESRAKGGFPWSEAAYLRIARLKTASL
ncbi:MAG: polyprenyl synthetase family protein, partial [Candidatus Aureabacteria bacterium]|nr:polyprenyl synthetase family protein [Candidatus Auribacterota bacterium]